ncbi:MAG TPA: acyl carrier protein [Anaerolineales bacterium]|nr:acyl carrier protein [Anaerolineae bacterium]HIQ00557.1 acyl carrier protein [Anaerolineales bacterium]
MSVQTTSVEATIRRYILESFLFTDDESQLPDDASFLEEGIVDSTGVLELVMFIEETFDISVEDEEILPENFDSVTQLARYVHRKKESDPT